MNTAGGEKALATARHERHFDVFWGSDHKTTVVSYAAAVQTGRRRALGRSRII